MNNWAGNINYQSDNFHIVSSIDDLCETVVQNQKIKAVGTRHAFNLIANCRYTQVSLENLNQILDLNSVEQTVTIQAGVRYGELCQFLAGEGFALHNLASLPHISVAGAVATATHGSGDQNGNLATAVSSFETVTATGETQTFKRGKDADFNGTVVSLGALGVVTQITLDVQPGFDIAQVVYRGLSFEMLKANFDAIMSAAYSVSLFTDWREITQIWQKHQVDPQHLYPFAADCFGAKLATKQLHPLPELSAEPCTPQMGASGPAFERLPHFRLEFTPSHGEELQSEYFVPREYGVDAILAIAKLQAVLAPYLMVSEIRTIAADHLWLSPCYQQDCVAIHFTWRKNWPEVQKLLPLIEEALQPFDTRPHWGKLFTMRPTYEKMPAFQALLNDNDPTGKFRNEFIEKNIFGD